MICVSLSNLSTCEILEELKELPMAEIRLDLLKITPANVKKIFQSHHNLIATCRPGNMEEQERMELISSAISGGAAFVDIEFESKQHWKKEIAEQAYKQGTKIILSSHNFVETPSIEELKKQVKTMKLEGAQIVKIACQNNSKEDSARILSLYAIFKDIIAIGMGPFGIVTRIAAPFLGAPFTFAAGKAGITAPGQMTYSEMQRIIQMINKGE
jgi:3-dehydroquinate dehydratase